MKAAVKIRRRLAKELTHGRVPMPKTELASLSEAWPLAKTRKRRQPMNLTDKEVDELLALPDPPDCWDDAYDGAY